MTIARSGLSFSDQVEDALRQQIVSGRRRPGERLNEVDLATELGVSRGPVREAMQRLARDGLVRVEAHRGAFVRQLDQAEIRALYEVRIALESTAAQLAAQRCTAGDLVRIRTLLDNTTSEVHGSVDPHYPTQLDLHRLVALAAGNDRLFRLIDGINRELTLVRATSGFQPARASAALDEHIDLFEAIAAGEAELAGDLMTAHLRHSLQNTMLIVADQPGA